MLSTTERTVTYRPTTVSTVRRLVAMARVPFTHMYASPIWLAVRLYLGWMWFNFGLQKLQAGWLTSDPIGQMLKLVADGTLAVPFEFYRPVAAFLVDSGLTPLLAHSMPFLEMAVALSFVTGVLVVPAAIGATLLNINFILSGIGAVAFDGRFIALQVLLILAFRIVGAIGFEPLIMRVLRATLRTVRPARKATLSAKC
jgi:thiosulfate dehydrogenase (quinone) large subunit